MSGLLWFVVWAVLIFLMMRYGCGAHVMGHGHAKTTGDNRNLRWVPPDTDPVCGKKVKTVGAKPSMFDGAVYYFCSRECREVFEAAPNLYVDGDQPARVAELEHSHG